MTFSQQKRNYTRNTVLRLGVTQYHFSSQRPLFNMNRVFGCSFFGPSRLGLFGASSQSHAPIFFQNRFACASALRARVRFFRKRRHARKRVAERARSRLAALDQKRLAPLGGGGPVGGQESPGRDAARGTVGGTFGGARFRC